MSQALNPLISQVKLALSRNNSVGTCFTKPLADDAILDPHETKKLLDSDDMTPALCTSLERVAEMRIKEKDTRLIHSSDGDGVEAWVSSESATPLAIKRRNFLLKKSKLDNTEIKNLAYCNHLIQVNLLQNIGKLLQTTSLFKDENVVQITEHLIDLNPEYNKNADLFLIPKESCVPAACRKFITAKFIKITKPLCLKLCSHLESMPIRLKMKKAAFATLFWECSDEKSIVDHKMEERKKRKDMENAPDDAGRMKHELYAMLKEFNPKVNTEIFSVIIAKIQKYIQYSNDVMLNMKFDSDRQERNKPKVLEKNKMTLQCVNDFTLKISQTFQATNEAQNKLLRRHKQLQADIRKFINEGELNKARRLFSELQDLLINRNQCSDQLWTQYTELEKIEERLSLQHQDETKMRCAQIKQNEKKFAKEEQRMKDILQDIDDKLKQIAKAEAENRKMQEAIDARRRRWDEQQKKREQEQKTKEEKIASETVLQNLGITDHEPKNGLLIFSKSARKMAGHYSSQVNTANDSSNPMSRSMNSTLSTTMSVAPDHTGHSKPLPLPLILNNHCNFEALLQYQDELQRLQTTLMQISSDALMKSASVCRMERSALLGIMARAMECLKVKQSGGIIHLVAEHFRNVIFHGFEESLFPKIGEDVKENAEANRYILDMACRMLVFLNSPGIKQVKTLDQVIAAVDSKLFTTIMKHTITAPNLNVCEQQILLGDYELLQYDKAKRELGQTQMASTLYHAAVGFSHARIGTYASFTRRQPEKEYLTLYHRLKQSMPLRTYIREGINFRHLLTRIK